MVKLAKDARFTCEGWRSFKGEYSFVWLLYIPCMTIDYFWRQTRYNRQSNDGGIYKKTQYIAL